MEEFLDEIVRAIRGRVAGGRSHREVAVELHLERSLVSRIVRGERGIGMRTLNSIMEADPPCPAANIPFFFKQWGGVRKRHSGRMLQGRTWDEMPQRTTGGRILRATML